MEVTGQDSSGNICQAGSNGRQTVPVEVCKGCPMLTDALLLSKTKRFLHGNR